MRDGCLLRNVVDANIVVCIEQELNDSLGPVGSVTQKTQVTERFFRTAELAFLLT